MKDVLKHRKVFIFLVILLMASVIYVFGESLSGEDITAVGSETRWVSGPTLPREAGVFRRAADALIYLGLINESGKRTMRTYYERRAYDGAPPMIPHVVDDERAFGGKVCLTCHENGGYVPKYQEYAPVVPHPELINCRQCHVPAKTNSLFRASDFKPAGVPALKQRALSTSPLLIPHQLHMRENCLACHAGPGAPQEIRTTHPERSNCRQCHMVQQPMETFSRPVQ